MSAVVVSAGSPRPELRGSADRRQRPPRFSGTRSGPRSGAFDSPARLGGTDSQQITQQLRRVAVAGIGRETTALGLGDRGDHGRTQSPPVALGFDESAQQVDIGQFRPSPRRRMRCRCSRMCVHPADPTSRIEHMFDKSACWVMRVRTGSNAPPELAAETVMNGTTLPTPAVCPPAAPGTVSTSDTSIPAAAEGPGSALPMLGSRYPVDGLRTAGCSLVCRGAVARALFRATSALSGFPAINQARALSCQWWPARGTAISEGRRTAAPS